MSVIPWSMDELNFSKAIHNIMMREMGDFGVYIIQKQCYEHGIMPEKINEREIPKLARALSEAMLDFGEEKARKILGEIKSLIKIDTIIRSESEPMTKVEMLSNMGDSCILSGNLEDGLKYYENAKEFASGNEEAIKEIDKRMKLVNDMLVEEKKRVKVD